MFFGWRMVGVAFTAHLVASGLGFYALPRLFVPLAEEFSGGALTGVSLLQVAMSAGGFVFGPLVGRAAGRYRLEVLMPCGALALAVGFFAAAFATELWQLLLVYALAVPFATGALSAIGANALVSNWFDQRRAFALGLSQVGISIPGAFIGFFVSWTLAEGSWRDTFLWFAAISLLAAPLFAWWIVGHPSQRGLGADGGVAPAESGVTKRHLSLVDAAGNRNLWIIGISSGLCFAGATGMIQHSINLARAAGHEEAQANAVLSLLSVGAALGKPLFGTLASRIGERVSYQLAIGNQVITFLLLTLTPPSFALLSANALLFGLSFGGVLPMMGALVARSFGPARFGPAMGYLSPIIIPFQLSGVPFASWVWDTRGNYDLALVSFAVASACAVGLSFLLRLPRFERPTAA